MSTLCQKRDRTSPATKMVTLECDDHSKLHEGSTSNASKKLSS